MAPTPTNASTERPSLIDWIAEVAPELDRFDYFGPYARAFEGVVEGGLRLAFAAPPQHGKTLLTLLGLLWLAKFFPGKRHAYVTYEVTRAEEVAKEFRRLAASIGMAWGGTLQLVELPGGTTVKFTSVGGQLTGSPIDGVCVIDDPIKGAREARSPTVRRDIVAWWKSTARARRHAATSFIVMATRWHVADLTGHLVDDEGWEYLNFKAIAEPENDNGGDDIDDDGRVISDPLHRHPGEALCPARKPPEFFAEERKDAYWWASMYQGRPRPEGGAVFGPATTYATCDRCDKPAALCPCAGAAAVGYRVGYGVDLAYTAKTSANYSVSIEGWLTTGPDRNGEGQPVQRLYIVDVQRKQVEATAFTLTLRTQWSTRRGPMRWYCATSEQGGGQFIKQKIPTFQIKLTTGDKFQRATAGGKGVASAWNRGHVLTPADAPWLEDFLAEIETFSGLNDPSDDQVDALAALWDVLATVPAAGAYGKDRKHRAGMPRPRE